VIDATDDNITAAEVARLKRCLMRALTLVSTAL
jgi:hypothetical protein